MNPHITPRKRFGQHFLIDKAIIEQIVSFINPLPTDNLVEIGPGPGALTVPLLKQVKQMSAIEIDRHLVPQLEKICQGCGEISIYTEDALSFDFSKLVKPQQLLRVVGNLPYNISTPLLFHLLEYGSHIQDMYFMLQKEVVDRLAAKPDSSDYGRLTVMMQYRCAVTALLRVPSLAFSPPPKVESKIVQLVPYAKLPHIALNVSVFENIVRQAFGMRRKTLRNALKKWVNSEIWESVGIDCQLRPEVLSVKDYVELSNAVVCQSSS